MPTFDVSAYDDTTHVIVRDLTHVATVIAWLAPTAYEHRAGGGGHTVICAACDGRGRLQNGEPCNDCVVAVMGDVGEIVLRRHDVARLLDEFARDLDRVWDTVKGMHGRVRKLEAVIDRGATLEGIGPPTIDPRDVLALVKVRKRRVRDGEVLPPDRDAAADAKSALRSAVRTAEAIDAAKERGETTKGGNRWRK